MAIEVHPITVPADLHRAAQIDTASFTHGIGHSLVGPPTPTNIDQRHAEHVKDFHRPELQFFKAVDTSTNAIIAISKWHYFPDSPTPEQLDKILELPKLSEDQQWKLPLFQYLHDGRREIMGTRPYAYCYLLAVDPAHQRRGAGMALMKEGCRKADEMGLPSYLEASVEAKALYEKLGFRVVKTTEFDMGLYGAPEEPTDVNCMMLREVPGKEGR